MYCPRMGRDRQQRERERENGRGSDTEVSRHNDFNFIKFKLGRTDVLMHNAHIRRLHMKLIFYAKYLHSVCG